MRNQALAAAIALSMAGCAGAPSDDAAGPAPPSSAARLGEAVVSVAGTPFLLAFKIPVCAATVAVAAPLAGAFALGGKASARAGQRALGEGIAANCGPPYVLSPSPAE